MENISQLKKEEKKEENKEESKKQELIDIEKNEKEIKELTVKSEEILKNQREK